MAKGDDLNKNLNETNKALFNAINSAARLTEETRNLTEELKDQLNIRSKQNEGEKTLLSLSRQITNSAQENKVALGQQGDIQKQIKKETNQLNSVLREQSILSNNLNSSQIEQANKIAEINKARLQGDKNISKTQELLVSASGKEKEELEKKLVNQRIYLNGLDYGLSTILDSADAETQRLALANQLVSSAQENLKVSEEEVNIRKKLNDALGLTGGALKSIAKIAGPFASSLKLDEVNKSMEEFAENAIRNKQNISRLQTLGVGAAAAFKNLGKTLTDPVVIIGALIKGFTAVDKEATDFARQTGEDINTMSTSIDSLNMGYVNMADYIRAASTLTKELGMNAANIFNKEDILEVAQMTDEIGLAGKEAANLAKFSKLNNTSIKDQNKSLIEGVNNFNKQNKTAISGRKILDDVANVSKGIAVSYTEYPEKLGEAATAAASLGMNLEQVDKIASSLLQFETSISAELEAELLIGKSINLEKARELALNNDLAGVANEVANQIGNAAEFSKMNRIQQEALAKAAGMTRDELAGSLIEKRIQGGLDEKALTAAEKQSYEAFKNREAQEKIAQSLAKIGQAFAPIVGFIADIVSNSYVLYSIMGIALLPKVLSLGSAFSGIFKSLSSIGGIGKKIGGMLKGIGKGIGGVLRGIGNGLSFFGRGALTAAPGIAAFGTASIPAIPVILALSAAVVGLGFALRLAAPAIEAIGSVISSVFGGIATVITAVTEGFATMFQSINSDNIGALLLLGPALLGISAGLAAMSVTGLLAMPTILALTALGSVAEGLGSIFGEEETSSTSEEGSLKAVENKLDKLIAVVEQGGDVFLDGNKVGKSLQLASSKIG